MFSRSGDYEIHIEAKNKLDYYAFLPRLLCEGINITIDQELCGLLSNAHRLLGILEGMSLYLLNIEDIEQMFIKKEAYMSCRIDGSTIPFERIFGQEKSICKDLEKIYNSVNAIRYSKGVVAENKISNILLCEMYSVIMNATDYKKSAAFRKIQIFELPKIYTPGFPTYNPPTAEYVEIAMIDLEKFIYRSDNIDVLIKAALIFYQFQTISPFKNENGKIGRMLLNLLLKTRKILSKQLLCFSSYIFQNKSHYKEILTDVRVVGNYTPWIKFFVKGLIIEANNSINSINEQVKLKQKNREKIGSLSKSKKSAMMLLEYLERNPIITLKTAAKDLGISFNTASNAVDIVQKIKVLKAGNDLMRNRSYKYIEYLEILEGISFKAGQKEDEIYD